MNALARFLRLPPATLLPRPSDATHDSSESTDEDGNNASCNTVTGPTHPTGSPRLLHDVQADERLRDETIYPTEDRT